MKLLQFPIKCEVYPEDFNEGEKYTGEIIMFTHKDGDPVAVVQNESGFLSWEYLPYVKVLEEYDV